VSREEAATIYLEVLLGFRGNYKQYLSATGALSEEDRSLLQSVVPGAASKQGTTEGAHFFGAHVDIDNQNHNEERKV